MGDSTPNTPDPEQAWKALSLVNDWIKHADTKVAASLAAAAATAIALYNLLDNEKHPNRVFTVAAVGCAALLFWTIRCALQALVPRVRTTRKPHPETFDNLLFFRHIARAYPPEKKAAYAYELASLTMDDQTLTRHIAEQVHANATVADRKFTWVNKTINALALAIGFLAIAALAAVWK